VRPDARRHGVDVEVGRQHHREAFALDALPALRSVVAAEQDAHASGPQRHGAENPLAFVLALDHESDDIAIPRRAGGEVADGERGSERVSAE